MRKLIAGLIISLAIFTGFAAHAQSIVLTNAVALPVQITGFTYESPAYLGNGDWVMKGTAMYTLPIPSVIDSNGCRIETMFSIGIGINVYRAEIELVLGKSVDEALVPELHNAVVAVAKMKLFAPFGIEE